MQHSSGHLEILKYLILRLHKCDVEAKTSQNATPLHLAAHFGQLQVVKFLIEDVKCDPQANSAHESEALKRTPLMLAASNHHLDVIKFLIESAKCDPNPIVDRRDKTYTAPFCLPTGSAFFSSVSRGSAKVQPDAS